MQTKIESLYDFATKKPGISPIDYGGYNEWYRKDSKEATKQRLIFLDLYRAVNSVLTSEQIEKQLERYEASKKDRMHYNGEKWEYTAGQYYPLEYRAAAARILWHILYSYVAESYDSSKIKTQLVRIAGRTVVNYFF